MKAAVVTGPGQIPAYSDFKEPQPQPGQEVITVSAAALTNATRSRAAGSHYSAVNLYPLVVGLDGVGRTAQGERVVFLLPEAPFGAMAEKTLVRSELCIPLPDGLEDVTAAALTNAGASPMAAFKFRADLKPGETVLVNGATGSAGKLAVQIAKYLGASRVVATGRSVPTLESLKPMGADATINLTLPPDDLRKAFEDQFASGIDVVLDYVYGAGAGLILAAAAKGMSGMKPLRYVVVGGMNGSEFTLSSEPLRAKPIAIMGSGLGSVPITRFFEATSDVIKAALPAKLSIPTRTVPLAQVAEMWTADTGKDRVVFVPKL